MEHSYHLSVISFTKIGAALSRQLLKKMNYPITLYTKCKLLHEEMHSTYIEDQKIIYVEDELCAWTANQFAKRNVILFIGACGIAVRAIAPSVRDKFADSPVLVMDEKGNYVIPILSGHVGGANAVAKDVSACCGATLVLTTATDVQEKFAVDLFAKENHLQIKNREKIAAVSAKVLRDEPIQMFIEENVCVNLDTDDVIVTKDREALDIDVWVGVEAPYGDYLHLKPKQYIVGMGCKKGKDFASLKAFFDETLNGLSITADEVRMLASIDVKKEEAGLIELASYYQIPFETFSKEQLQNIDGAFSASTFVENTVGVDNVCERAAMATCEGGKLVLSKQTHEGMTIAIARMRSDSERNVSAG
ncbi:MAG: cobalamin biosynthesis protein [Eubacteriales bacterium]|nr:cobalamin biosynthesis protein [Eubacteriales bacterium]